MAEERPPFLPEQFYEDSNIISTYDFIYFIQDYITFLREYLNHMRDENYITPDDYGYYNSFIDICEGINTDYGDDGTFETYRATIEPLMEWMTEECGDMNLYHEEKERNTMEEAVPKGVSSRTRSKRPASGFEIPSSKRGTNVMTQGPITQDSVRIKLSDGKEYTYGELKHMMDWNKDMTPYRHPYTEEDKNKIAQLMDFATKGGKKTIKNKKNSKKTKKARKNRSKKVRKNKRTKTRR
jgi:hypothetical protein